MNRGASLFALLAFGTFCTSSTIAMAAHSTIYSAPDKSVAILGGVGYTWLKGNELAYDEVGNRISKLIWETGAPVLTTGVKAEVWNNWIISANAVFGFSGNSHMEDYDWLAPSFAERDWSDQSIHPDTRLDRYIDLDMAAGPDFVINDATVINLHGGVKYTNMTWKAYGGSYIYSGDGFRDDRGEFPDGEPGIDYEQRYFGLFLGAEATTTLGNLTLSGLLRSGLTVDASAVDDHWRRELRGLRFQDDFFTVPFISAGAKIDYQMTDRASVFLAANGDKYFRKKGYETTYNIASGQQQGVDKDSAGMDFYAFTLRAGFELTF
ncbi:MAG: omptin family outer membrane protease [Mesorhizobium sp.]|nr:MAG: omptin family outer membrane protease [Mesorhizobium sp.]